jgi:hypothetical protein
MRTYPFAPNELLALAVLSSPARAGHADAHADAHASDGARLHALGGPSAIMAAADKDKSAPADMDDWSGSLDIHLGVYTND